ncbi:porin [Paraburkholderia hayleyella]|uniref:porin n=1 Tax=Paraburkholderia hayleyella TaxID=2152889 RepID=UPI001290B5AA|nr:porin [Paraburkholderia hayleyella]
MSPNLKKTLATLAVSTVAAVLGTPALAQSSVTLYGEIDAGFAYANNVGGNSQYKMTSGLIDGSYWGLKGAEDLGGGNKAIFVLERGFSIGTGESFNDHPYYVGLDNASYGTVTLGHQYDSIHDYFAPFTLTGGNGGTAFAHPFDNDNANNSYLARNSIKYASPSFGGFSFGGMYAFSNGAGQFANNRAYSVGANYQNGGFNAGAAYLHINGRGNTGNGAYESVSLPGASKLGGVFNANVQTQNTYGAGASYALGNFTLGGAWSRSTYTGVVNADTSTAAPSVGFSNYEVNGIYQLTPVMSLAGMYTYTKGNDTHWNQGALQIDYQLSKRTDTYLETLYQRAASGTSAIINSFNPSQSSSQFVVAAGIRHRF